MVVIGWAATVGGDCGRLTLVAGSVASEVSEVVKAQTEGCKGGRL